MLNLEDLRKERGKRRQALIAKTWGVSSALNHSVDVIRTNIGKVKSHEISEWELVESTQQEVLQLFVECGLTEMMEAFVSFTLVDQAIAYEVGQKETTKSR